MAGGAQSRRRTHGMTDQNDVASGRHGINPGAQPGRHLGNTAQHRAVGLLQHVATSVASPAEYQVPLAKVLCGMDLAEVFSFGDAVCTEERDESLNLLAAVAQHVPALRERSPDELRAEILQRSGVLSRGPGSWLLRVERHAEEDALDAVPWSMAWIKQPWMTTPLAVEW